MMRARIERFGSSAAMSANRLPAAGGFALLAVLVVLSMLLALSVPFALSMDNGDAVSRQMADAVHAEMASANARDLVLHRASLTHDTLDEDTAFDARHEFPSQLEVPEAFAALRGQGFDQNLLAAEVYDLQRRINLNTATPLVLGNLLGLVARTSEQHDPDFSELVLAGAANFKDQGYVMVGRELIRYTHRDGNVLGGLSRGLLAVDKGYQPYDEERTLPPGALVFDYRVLLAISDSFYHAEDDRRDRRRPLGSIEEINRIGELGFGEFSPQEIDLLRQHCTVASVRERAADWGRAERVFEPLDLGLEPWSAVVVTVRSARSIGAGSVVRIRNLRDGGVEYGVVWAVRPAGDSGTVALPSRHRLVLMRPPSRSLAAFDTVVEVLLPHPVNVNTASADVLSALVAGVGSPPVGVEQHTAPSAAPFSAAEARAVAESLLALRGDEDYLDALAGGLADADELRPFDGFEDLAERFFEPRFAQAEGRASARLLQLYRSFLGQDIGVLRMATAPLSFTSAPVVAYRAAAARVRGTQTAARHERTGVAVAMPDATLDLVLATQAQFEEAVRVDGQIPFYTTHPINLGAPSAASNPPSRHIPHVLATAYPDLGFGESRFASVDGASDGFRLAPAATRPNYRGNEVVSAFESMSTSRHPEGRDVAQEGGYSLFNTGPRTGSQAVQSPNRHAASFPFTGEGGLPQPHAVQFWFQVRDVDDQILFDLAADRVDANRIKLSIEEQHLVFEVLDEAGLDPDSGQSAAAGTAPERTAGTWRVPLTDIDLRPEVWFHVNLAASGNQPGQLSMTVDGTQRGEPDLRTYLAAPIDPYQESQEPIEPFFQDALKYLDIRVEDTEGFPPQGVLRIGLELFEYTSKTATTFRCAFDNSMGGRTARMRIDEFAPTIPVDNNGRPTVNVESIQGLQVAAGHELGAAVELYGYTVPVYRDTTVYVSAGRLQTSIGAFAVARAVVDPGASIQYVFNGRPREVGKGIDVDSSEDISLADPIADRQYPPAPASQPILDAFPATGGYALLVQRFLAVQSAGNPGNSSNRDIGGIELIRYSARTGDVLSGIQRGLTLPPVEGYEYRRVFDGKARHFVTQWTNLTVINGNERIPAEELHQYLCYVVPISLPVAGANLPDPTVIGRSEWAQIYSEGDEANTEWVRYDYLDPQGWLVRANLHRWLAVWRELTDTTAEDGVDNGEGAALGGQLGAEELNALLTRFPYPEVRREAGVGYIGYTDDVEFDPNFPQIQLVRRALRFRGDPLTGTTSHAHGSNAMVLPCHRFELDWGNYGARSGRAGRNDRIALVAGSQASGTERPGVEWHTVNWAARRFAFDADPGNVNDPYYFIEPDEGVPREMLGLYPFQLVGLKAGVGGTLLIGPEERNFNTDSRQLDRMVKFPSGELPAAAAENGEFGTTPLRDLRDCSGIVDDIGVVNRRARALLLDEELAQDGRTFLVRTDLVVTPYGYATFNGDLTRTVPQAGGLVSIDGEILAYESHSDGTFVIASEGRGLLGSEPRPHSEGALVYFLDHIPAAILTAPVNGSASELVVADAADLPAYGGTLLLARNELLHYAWVDAGAVLTMPSWDDPDAPQTRGRGLLRGRYGTTPVGAGVGEPVIWFPQRYWDRHHERADDPELAYFQITWDLAPVFFRGLLWEEERDDELIDVECLVRIDGRGSFADDPETSPHLFRFDRGGVENPIGRQGSRIEARFSTVYRPGAFDPQTFRANTWKKAPMVRALLLDYEGEGRVLDEKVTAQ